MVFVLTDFIDIAPPLTVGVVIGVAGAAAGTVAGAEEAGGMAVAGGTVGVAGIEASLLDPYRL